MLRTLLPFLAPLLLASAALAQDGQATPNCRQCATWNAPQKPFRIYGNTWYVGVGLSSILITGDQGDILIDGDLNESAPLIAEHIQALGFKLSDVKVILNSHAHYDHAGGLSQLQRLTGAKMLASPWSAGVLRTGKNPPDDPQYGALQPIAPVANVGELHDGEVVKVGPLALTAHFTPGHTPGGTSWSWSSCENGKCLNIVYADSQTAVSADGYRYTAHPELLQGFTRNQALFASLPCDVLLTPHPEFSPMLKGMLKGESLKLDANACRSFADTARVGVEQRVADEKAGKK
jgi:metallo-beta-lactamase class B